MTWVYKQTEHGPDYNLYTVGFYDPTGKWHSESDHGDQESAAARVAWLNGGQLQDAIDVANNAIVRQMQREKPR